MKKLLLTGLLAALAVPATMSAMDDALTLTFNVDGSGKNLTPSAVSINTEGVDGVSATLNSIKEGDSEIGIQSITGYPGYVCPNSNTGTATNESTPQTFNFTISGLPNGYTIDNINLTTAACTGSQTPQGSMNRTFQVDALINNQEFINFGVIDVALNTNNGAKSWLEDAKTPYKVSNNSIELTISVYSTENIGNFVGLAGITFNYVEPIPDYNVEDVLGTYEGSFWGYLTGDEEGDEYTLNDVVITKGSGDNSVVIYNLCPSLTGYSVNGTFDPFNNTITVAYQYVRKNGTRTSYLFDPYDWDTENYVDALFIVQGNKIAISSDQVAIYVYDETEEDDMDDILYEIELTKVSDSTEVPEVPETPEEPNPELEALLGTYYGTYLKGSDYVDIEGVEIKKGSGSNGLVISNLFPGLGNASVTATYSSSKNTITISSQYISNYSSEKAYFYPYYNGAYQSSITLSVTDGNITSTSNQEFYIYDYGTAQTLMSGYYDLNIVKEGDLKYFEVDGIQYEVLTNEEGNRTVMTKSSEYSNIGANNDLAGEVVIPATVTYKGLEFTVTGIGKYSFSQAKITNLTIPATVTKINYAAFFNCSDLQYVTDLATKPQSIGTYDYVFYGSSYNSAVLFVPEESVAAYKAATEWQDFGKVIAIGDDPNKVNAGDNFEFEGIIYTVIDPAEFTVKTKNGTYFSQDGYWEGQNVGKENLEIPEKAYFQGDPYTVIEIGEGSFAYCDEGEGLKSIVIPNTVETIGEGAFSENYNVTSISFGSGLKTIGADAFYSADSLEEVSITAVVPPVADEDAFFSTNVAVVTLTVPTESVEAYATADVWKEFNLEVTVNVTISQPEDEEVVKEVVLDGTAVENWTEGFEATSGQGLSITFDVPEGYELTVTVNEVDVTEEVEDNVYTTVVGYVDLAIEVTLTAEETDGINSIESVDGIEAIYNLNGVRVSKDRLTKGLYIINGQKVFVK